MKISNTWRVAACWAGVVLPCVLTGFMNIRSRTHWDVLMWSGARTVAAHGVSAKGFFADSRVRVLEIGMESVTWSGPGMWTSSRTFPSPAGKPGFRFESRRWYGSILVGLGFWKTDYVDWQPAYRNHQWMVRIPWWFLWVISLGVAGIYYLRRRGVNLRAKRIQDGLCVRCGYDLRASPGRCPECGRDAGKGPIKVIAIK